LKGALFLYTAIQAVFKGLSRFRKFRHRRSWAKKTHPITFPFELTVPLKRNPAIAVFTGKLKLDCSQHRCNSARPGAEPLLLWTYYGGSEGPTLIG